MRSVRWLSLGLLLVVVGGAALVTSIPRAGDGIGTVTVGRQPTMIALDTQTHRAFVTNGGATSVSVLDTGSGAVLRTVPVVARPQDVAVDTRTNRAFVVNAIVDLSVLDTRSGAVLRTLNLGLDGGLEADIVVADAAHRVVVASTSPHGGVLTVLDAQTGAVLHRVHIGASGASCTTIGLAVDEQRGQVFTTDSADAAVSVVALATGRVVRTIAVGGNPTALALDARRNHVLVATTGAGAGTTPSVRILDATSGAVLHTAAVDANPAAVVVDARLGHAFVLTENGTSLLDTRTGAVLRRVPAGPPDTAPAAHAADLVVDTGTSRAFVINPSVYDDRRHRSYESVSILDARSGQVLRRLPVGQAPVALALDEARGHLFVVNSAGTSPDTSRRSDVWGWVPRAVRQRLPWLPQAATTTTSGSVTMLDVARV